MQTIQLGIQRQVNQYGRNNRKLKVHGTPRIDSNSAAFDNMMKALIRDYEAEEELNSDTETIPDEDALINGEESSPEAQPL
jgi:hypothetical protein